MVGWPHRLNGHEFEQTLGDSERRGTWHAAVHGVTKSQTQLSNCTTTTYTTYQASKCETEVGVRTEGDLDFTVSQIKRHVWE